MSKRSQGVLDFGMIVSESKKYHKPCHESHPELSIGGGTFIGASCGYPRDGADVYIGLDWNMANAQKGYPWEKGYKLIEQVAFRIPDMCAPSSPEDFKKLVSWVCNQLQDGKTVHAGCIGGHGRTGTLLAAVMAQLGEKDAIGWVRKNYCKKAVESKAQVDFLVKHFGVSPAQATKSHVSKHHSKYSGFDDIDDGVIMKSSSVIGSIAPVRGTRSVWGA